MAGTALHKAPPPPDPDPEEPAWRKDGARGINTGTTNKIKMGVGKGGYEEETVAREKTQTRHPPTPPSLPPAQPPPGREATTGKEK